MDSNPYIGRVNCQLMYARHQLDLRLEEHSAADQVRNQGVLNAALWHLSLAYRAYLAELGANYQLQDSWRLRSAGDLSQALLDIGKHPAESRELERLENEGFIRFIVQHIERIEQPDETPENAVRNDQTRSDSVIALRDVTDQDPAAVGFEVAADWMNELRTLIDRHREHMVEY